MKAAILHKFGQPLGLEERPQPESEPGGIVLRVLGAGVCHTDLHMIDGAIPEIALPLVLGHEITGESEELGPVLVYPCWGCGKCRHCLSGEEQLCPNGSAPGWTRDGGYAEYLAVPSQRYLIPLQGLDPIRAAPLADAGVTPYRAVRRALPWLHRGGNVMVLGAGGLGQFAIQYLKLLAPFVAVAVVDIDSAKCERARELGAHAAMTPDEVTARSDVVLDFVGTTASLALAARVVERRGLVVQIGEGGMRLLFGIGATEQEATFTTSIWGSREDLRAVLELAHSGRIVWGVEEFPLDEANAALDRLRQGKIRARAVLRP
jgi:alcohol dehydrogenase, propanol-preferring